MKQLFGGKIINLYHVADMKEFVHVSILVDNSPEEYGKMTVEDFKIVEFNIFKGNYGFKEFLSTEHGTHIQIRGDIWKKNKYINVKLDGFCLAPETYYQKPIIEEIKQPTIKKITIIA